MQIVNKLIKRKLNKATILLITLFTVCFSGCITSATPPGTDIVTGEVEPTSAEISPPPTLTRTPTSQMPTPTPSPTPPTPTAEPTPQRIRFAQGATSAAVSDTLPPKSAKRYILRALSGQMLVIDVTAPLALGLNVSGENGTILVQGLMNAGGHWEGRLPSTQDYVIELISPATAVDYQLTLSIPRLTEPTPTMSTYRDAEHGFELHYSPDFGAGETCPNAVIIHDPVISFRLVGDTYYEGTNLLDACVTVGIDRSAAGRATCMEADTAYYEEYLGQEAINGVLFAKLARGGVAAGHIHDVTVYRTLRDNICYEITQFLHYSNIGVYQPGTVVEFDKDVVVNKLKQVILTFRFTNSHYMAANPNYPNSPAFRVGYSTSDWTLVPGDGLGRPDQLQHHDIEGCTLWLQAGPSEASPVSTVKPGGYEWKIFYQSHPRSLIYSTPWEDVAFIFRLMLPEPAPKEAKSPCQQAAEDVLMTFSVQDDGDITNGLTTGGTIVDVPSPTALPVLAVTPTAPALPTPNALQVQSFAAEYVETGEGRELEQSEGVALSWEAEGEHAAICPLIGDEVVGCRCLFDVPLVGSHTIKPSEIIGRYSGFQLAVEAGGIRTVRYAPLAVACPDSFPDWFFEDPPEICPKDAPLPSYAAAQRFEHGLMIWNEALDEYDILFDHHLAAAESPQGTSSLTSLRIIKGPLDLKPGASADNRVAETPPPGRLEPVSGFGLLWRGEVTGTEDLRAALGWALAPEYGFDTVYQCAMNCGAYWDCYLRGPEAEGAAAKPNGEILHLYWLMHIGHFWEVEKHNNES